jgi:hypothetical protein
LQGFLLLAAVGIDTLHHELRHSKRWGFVVGTIGVLLLYGALGYLLNLRLDQSKKACFTYAADIRNPYVYAHTGMDAMKLVESIEQAAILKKGQGMYEVPIAIAAPASDYWPLPWYLRKYATARLSLF